MRLEILTTPSKERPLLITIRHIPENKRDEKAIKTLDLLLRGTACLHTSPEIDGKTCLSMMFKAYQKEK